MEVGTIVSWEKKEGDKLNEGDLLAEIETDKATMGFETPEEGYLAKILIPAGTKEVPIGKLVCIIVESESDVAAFKDYKDDGAAAPPPAKAAAAESASVAPQPPKPAITPAVPPPAAPAVPSPPSDSSRVYASPMAKRLAEQRNIRLQGKGTVVLMHELIINSYTGCSTGDNKPNGIEKFNQQYIFQVKSCVVLQV